MTGFLAQLRNRDHDWLNCTTIPTKQSCLFKYLLSDTDYDIRVQAANQKGWSDAANVTMKTEVTGVLFPGTIWQQNKINKVLLRIAGQLIG